MLLGTRGLELPGTSRLYKRLMEERFIKLLDNHYHFDNFLNHDHFAIFIISIFFLLKSFYT